MFFRPTFRDWLRLFALALRREPSEVTMLRAQLHEARRQCERLIGERDAFDEQLRIVEAENARLLQLAKPAGYLVPWKGMAS